MGNFIIVFMWALFGIANGLILVLAAIFLYLNPQVPAASTFRDVKLRAPLRIYSADHKLIREFGERLIPITFEQIPPLFIRALLDTEDKRFFTHSGIDMVTVTNATWQLILNKGSIKTGASTITMQLVKNISGATEVRFIRKFKEMLLALKIERELTKQDILTLYLNIIPFGKHAFGLQAAANTYYGKHIDELTLAQMAMLAGIPQAPEAGNPINNPKRALARRNFVLARMLEQGSITQSAHNEAASAPITAEVHGRSIELPALYVAEMVRKRLLNDYGKTVYNDNLVVHTTLDSKKQLAAKAAITQKLNEYDRRHGYRGPEFRRIQGADEYLSAPGYDYPTNWIATLNNSSRISNQNPGIVIAVRQHEIDLINKNLTVVTIPWEGLSWARPYINENKRGAKPQLAADIVAIGDLVRYEVQSDGSIQLGQVPSIQAALVSLNPLNGAIEALIGGYDFKAQQYNHATQARRQPGSNFKPFFYAGAIENGLTAASIYNDAPMVLPGGALEEIYRPSNVDNNFDGQIRLREALFRSKNLVSLRIILDFGTQNTIDYVQRFGFDTENFPRNVQLAFGGGTIALTPLELAVGYASFANGGHKIDAYLITRISYNNTDVLYQAKPSIVCLTDCTALFSNEKTTQSVAIKYAEQIVEPRVAYIMDSILADVITHGTGKKALKTLKRNDLRGKTGTTNHADIWFSGYTHDLVTTTWAGFDNNSPVGSREWGSTTPLEIWAEYMAVALPPEEAKALPFPDRLVNVRIDPKTGLRAKPTNPDAIFEIFREEYAPAAAATSFNQDENNLTQQPLQEIF